VVYDINNGLAKKLQTFTNLTGNKPIKTNGKIRLIEKKDYGKFGRGGDGNSIRAGKTGEQVDDYVYHTTSPSRLDSIKNSGLKPGVGQFGRGVYFAPNMYKTGLYGSSEGAMLRVKRNKLPKDFQEFLYDTEGKMVSDAQGWTNKNIPSDIIEASTDGGKTWKALVNKPPKLDNSNSFVAYHGTNNPDAIRKGGFSLDRKFKEDSSFVGDDFFEGIYVTKDKSLFKDDGQLADVAEVLKLRIPKKLKLAKNLNGKEIEDYIEFKLKRNRLPTSEADHRETMRLLTEDFKKMGYDGIDLSDGSNEIIIFDPKNISINGKPPKL